MLYIFDKDGTLVGGAGNRPANIPEEQKLLPNVVQKISALKMAGHKIAIASNQGGVAWGFISSDQAENLVLDAAHKIGGVDSYRFSPYDPKAQKKNPNSVFAQDHESRKPRAGMIISLMDELGYSPSETVMVGDMESDELAAEKAGCSFAWAKDFFND